jgi:hypothetical protein
VAHADDIAISRKLYARYPKFGAEILGLATRDYLCEVHMGNDREDFENDPSGVPVYEGRMVEAFDHRAKAYDQAADVRPCGSSYRLVQKRRK